MSELSKLAAGEWYQFKDSGVAAQKARAAKLCQEFNQIPATDPAAQTAKMQEILGAMAIIYQCKPILTAIMVVTFTLATTF